MTEYSERLTDSESVVERILRQYRGIKSTTDEEAEQVERILSGVEDSHRYDMSDFCPAGHGANVGALALWACVGNGTNEQAITLANISNGRMAVKIERAKTATTEFAEEQM